MVAVVSETRPCKECGEALTYVPERERKRISDPGWVHAATGEAWMAPGNVGGKHFASPRPRCPKCKSEAYAYTAGAWGDIWDCSACGHHEYYSLGD
jgi:hypothetical protein